MRKGERNREKRERGAKREQKGSEKERKDNREKAGERIGGEREIKRLEKESRVCSRL